MPQVLAEFTLMTVADDAGRAALVLADPETCLFLRCLTADPATLDWVPGHLRALNGGGMAVSGTVTGPLRALEDAPDRALADRIVESFEARYPHTRLRATGRTRFLVTDRQATGSAPRTRRKPCGVWI